MSVVSSVGAAPATSRTVELVVGGMTCAACAARVERKLNKLDGVQATVNLATEKATVDCPATVDVDRLIAEVEKAGYQAKRHEPEATDDARAEAATVKSLWHRLIVALLLTAPVGDLSITQALVPALRFPGWQWVLLVLTLPVATWCAWPFHRVALRNARHLSTSMDTLVSVGITASVLWSVYTIFFVSGGGSQADGVWGLIFRPGGAIYLDVAAGVTTFLLAGRLFEAKARRRAGGALRALAALGAKDVAILDADGTEHRMAIGHLKVGQDFVVRPGETVATDGVVRGGHCAVDTSTMTGESMPVEIGAGDAVTGGTIALHGRLVVTATRVGADTQLAHLVRLVEQAQTDKAGIQRLADRICGVFVPVVFGLAALTLLGWLVFDGPEGVGPHLGVGIGSVQHAIGAALAVLIIACPCALGLATPTALLVASGRGAQLGIFIKGHQALESARAIDTVVLDKTGTITHGRMAVADLITVDADQADVLRMAGALEEPSEHVAAAAITARAKQELGALPEVTDFTSLAGLGVRGVLDGRDVLVGSARLLAEHDVTIPAELDKARTEWEANGHTTVLLAADGVALGAFALADTVKPSAKGAIAELRAMGLRTVLLTGDNTATARSVASEVGIDEVIAKVMPDDKEAVIQRLQAEGHSVAMVGDGVNDAPALARADLGLAVVSGTDVALGAADLILVRDDLDVVPGALKLARSTLRTIHGNLAWAFGYNVAALPLAAFGLLNPLIAGGAMALSSLFVVSNSLRLRRFTLTAQPQPQQARA
jgi:cation-transporting P-type ATPase A/B/Cu+-exporting ATPase